MNVASVVLTVLMALTLPSLMFARRHPNTRTQDHTDNRNLYQLNEETEKEPWEKYAKYAHSKEKNEDRNAYCHKVALKRCGSSFMKVFHLFAFLPEDKSFMAKCALRTAFYNCLEKYSIKSCSSHRQFRIEPKFRKRLADNLWAMRTCVLGIKM